MPVKYGGRPVESIELVTFLTDVASKHSQEFLGIDYIMSEIMEKGQLGNLKKCHYHKLVENAQPCATHAHKETSECLIEGHKR